MKLTYLIALYIAAVTPMYAEAPNWVLIAAGLLAGHAYLAVRGQARFLPAVWTGILSVGAVGGCYFHFKTLLGPEAASSLLILLGGLKLQELRSRRDTIVGLYMMLLLTMYYLLFSQTLLATLYMFGMILAVGIAFIFVNTPAHHFKTVLRSAPRLATKDLLISLPIFAAFFVFFPRFTTPWASLVAVDKTQVGFTDSLQPGDMANLAKSKETAFRATFAEGVPRPRLRDLYWRGAVLEKTNGWAWSALPAGVDTFRAAATDTDLPRPVAYTVTLEPKFKRYLFALDSTATLQWSNTEMRNPIYEPQKRAFHLRYPLVSRSRYEGKATFDKKYSEPLTERELGLLRTIEKPSEKIQTLVETIQSRSKNVHHFAHGVLDYFQAQNFRYSTQVPATPDLEAFLFQSKIGFCEHFASATASLLRYAGYPARVVTGFQGGEFSFMGDYLIVRDDNAHSWLEYYTDGAWYSIDPTTVVNSLRLEFGSLSESLLSEAERSRSFSKYFSQASLLYDMVENRYNQFLLNYDLDAQTALFQTNVKKSWMRYALFLLAILGASVFLFLAAKLLNRPRSRDELGELFEKIKAHLRRRGLAIHDHDGPMNMTQKLEAHYPHHREEAQTFLTEFIEIRYSSHSAHSTSHRDFSRRYWSFIRSLPKNTSR